MKQRLARWLLLARHRIGSDQVPLTHEFLSMMLAVRRAGVTVAIGTLEFFFSSRRRHTSWTGDWSSDVCSSDLRVTPHAREHARREPVANQPLVRGDDRRSEERRVGKECRTGSLQRWSQYEAALGALAAAGAAQNRLRPSPADPRVPLNDAGGSARRCNGCHRNA